MWYGRTTVYENASLPPILSFPLKGGRDTIRWLLTSGTLWVRGRDTSRGLLPPRRGRTKVGG